MPRNKQLKDIGGWQNTMLTTRTLGPHEFTQIEEFYNKNRYGQPISPDDHFLVIQSKDELIGALRICHEQSVFVLKGMLVADAFQRQGAGSKLLDYFTEFIGEHVCFCIAHTYLKDFYARVGFEEIGQGEAPGFLVERLHLYQTKLGLDELLLYRPSRGNQVVR